ncbi:MAG TPA: winged helix DNA-binding domain-containing protein [Solirubrobacteraceae bacterium]|nr:winged helix DNA-binding domain-containing protein [Solirubrobacteraceae bacterium]
MVASVDVLSDRALNRALLARQGLLDRFDAPVVDVVDVVERIGAMQGQAWSALPVGLWSRIESFVPGDLYAALAAGDLRWGIGLRGTLHLVSAGEHPGYAVVADGVTRSWHRVLAETSPGMDALRADLLSFAGPASRTGEEIRDFVERWVADHPDAIDPAEVVAQRSVGWRPIYRWTALTRVPNGGLWGTKAPADHLAVAVPPESEHAPSRAQALAEVTRRHLRAFGPASVDDIASWTGTPTPGIRAVVNELDDELVGFDDEHGRRVHDLPDAPRPDPQTLAPARLLGAFDSILLAYASNRRGRIMPDALKNIVYQKGNLQIRPSFLVDGLVAGTWSAEVRRREATLTLRPVGKLTKAAGKELTAEADGLLRVLHPAVKAHHVVVE